MTATSAHPAPRSAYVRRPGGDSRALRCGPVSVVVRPRAVAVAVVLVALLVAAVLVALSVGEFPVPLADVARSLVGAGEGSSDVVVRELRLPRVVCGLLVGAALGLSGALTQAVARNPLASPDVLGVTAGAAAGAVGVIVLGAAPGGPGVATAALLGGLGTALAVYLLAHQRGVSGTRLVLVGIGTTYALQAVISYLVLRAELVQAQQATLWLTGSLSSATWEQVRTVGLAVLVLLPLALALTRSVTALQFGDDTARGLGVRTDRARTGLLLVGVAVAAFATAAAGPIAFVALAAPQLAVRLARTPGLPLVTSTLVGALLVVAADVAARRLLAPTELPVGVVTAVLGAPFLLWLLARAHRGGPA